jgi:hypothetical protein
MQKEYSKMDYIKRGGSYCKHNQNDKVYIVAIGAKL